MHRPRGLSIGISTEMDFREAVERLLRGPTHDDVAREFERPSQSVRQMRLDEAKKGHRVPPAGWPAAIIRLAEREIERLRELIDELRKD